MSLLKLAIFDCDGTLVDSERSIVDCMRAAFADLDFEPPGPSAVRQMVGLPLLEAIARLLPREATAVHETLRQTYIDSFAVLRQTGTVHEPLFDGISETLDQLDAAQVLMGVATGKAHKGLVNTLKTHSLEDRFVTLQTADRARGKPHPEMVLNALSETGVRAADAVVIGDTTYDIEMARNAGTLAIGVSWGYHDPDDLLAAGAHVVVDDSADLFATITDIFGET